MSIDRRAFMGLLIAIGWATAFVVLPDPQTDIALHLASALPAGVLTGGIGIAVLYLSKNDNLRSRSIAAAVVVFVIVLLAMGQH